MSLPPLRTVLSSQSPTASLPSSLSARSSEPVWDGYGYTQPLDPHAIQLTISVAPVTKTSTGSVHDSTTSEEEPAPRTPSPTPAKAPPMTVLTGEAATLLTGYRHVHRKPKAKRNRKGWGPYQSVTRERAVNFNLTLDVQNLKQEIQQLTTARDLLQSRMLQLRHSPTGSLMQMIREYYQIFRTGFRVEERGRRRHVITAGVQRDFLYSVVDHNIDFGNGIRGVEFLVEMLRRYSQLMRFVSMDLESFTIVTSDDGDGIVIETRGPLRLQILRETIATLFPHILGNEWLCSRLIGATVVAAASVTYHFNDTNRICLLVPDADYVAAFSQVLPDPQDVQELMGQAKIDDKSMLGVSEDGQIEHLDPYAEEHLHTYTEPEAELGVVAQALDKENSAPVHNQQPAQQAPPPQATQPVAQAMTQRRPPPQKKPQPKRPIVQGPRPAAHQVARKRGFDTATADDLPPPDYLRVASAYILAFANGWPADDDTSAMAALPRKFLVQHVSSQVVVGRAKGHAAIEHAWRALGATFELLGFRATSQPQLYDDGETVSARVRVAYELAIDIGTLQTVFPHVLRSPVLVQALLGAELVCPSELLLEWHDDDARVSRVRERIDWDAALAPLLPPAQVRAFVLDGARLTPEGYVAVPV